MSDTFAASSSLENGDGPSHIQSQDHGNNSCEMNTATLADESLGARTSTTHSNTEKAFEEMAGPEGLAFLKTYDVRFGSYHCFPNEIARCLDELAAEVYRASEIADNFELKLQTKYPDNYWRLPFGNRHRKRYDRVRRNARQKMAAYLDFCTKANSVLGYPRPREESIEELRVWTRARFPEHHRMFLGKDRDDFRILGPKRRVVEEFVKTLPLNAFGKYLCGCFRKRGPETSDLEFENYGDKGMSVSVVVVKQVGLVIFVILPMTLISYHAVSEIIGVSVILVLSCLMCLLTQILYDGEDFGFLAVCGYTAIMAALLGPPK